MSRATKLLNKTKKIEERVRRNAAIILKGRSDVTDIKMKKVVKELVFEKPKAMELLQEEVKDCPPVKTKKSKKQHEKEKFEQEQEEDKFLEENSELMDALTELERIEAFTTKAISIERIDYTFPDERDYGLEIQVPTGIITASNIRSGDEVVFNSGALEGRSLEVIEVLNSTTLRLDDVPTYSGNETNISIRFTIN